MWETRVWFLDREDPLEKEMAIHSSILAWEIPWTEEPGSLQSMGLQRVWHNWATNTLWGKGWMQWWREAVYICGNELKKYNKGNGNHVSHCWTRRSLICKGRRTGLHSPWNSPGQNTGVGRLSLLQGIFPTQGLSPGLLDCRQILYQLSHRGSPRILKWVSLSLLQGIFPTQESNRDLLHCRQILYQLSYEASPRVPYN